MNLLKVKLDCMYNFFRKTKIINRISFVSEQNRTLAVQSYNQFNSKKIIFNSERKRNGNLNISECVGPKILFHTHREIFSKS